MNKYFYICSSVNFRFYMVLKNQILFTSSSNKIEMVIKARSSKVDFFASLNLKMFIKCKRWKQWLSKWLNITVLFSIEQWLQHGWRLLNSLFALLCLPFSLHFWITLVSLFIEQWLKHGWRLLICSSLSLSLCLWATLFPLIIVQFSLVLSNTIPIVYWTVARAWMKTSDRGLWFRATLVPLFIEQWLEHGWRLQISFPFTLCSWATLFS